MTRAEATALLEAAQQGARPVSPQRLGHVGEVEGWPLFHARGEGTFSCGGIGRLSASIPFVVEAWASADRSAYRDTCSVFVNRTPITGTVNLSRWRRDLMISGCGLSSILQAGPGRSGIDLRLNIITPYMPITSDGKAMTTPQFIAWLDDKMAAFGNGKLVPPARVLENDLSETLEHRLHRQTADHPAARCRPHDSMAALDHGAAQDLRPAQRENLNKSVRTTNV